MRLALRAWRYLYGENPLHLLAVLACFALAGYVVSILYTDPSWYLLLIWFVGAVIGHDLVLYPLYALADQPLVLFRWARRKALPRVPVQVPVINHIRLPVLGAMVLGLIYLPTITQHGGDSFAFAAGHPLTDQYQNWLGITGLLFLVSAVLYALRLGEAAGRGLLHRLRRPTVGDDDAAAPTPVAAGAALAAPAESGVTANGHTPAESALASDDGGGTDRHQAADEQVGSEGTDRHEDVGDRGGREESPPTEAEPPVREAPETGHPGA